MTHNIQSVIEQKIKQCTIYICGDCPTNESWGNSRRICHASLGGYLDQVHSDQMVLMMAMQESWTAVRQ